MACVEFQYCGHIDEDSKRHALEIAEEVGSEAEAWALVDALDSATKEAIYEVGIFREV